jgi:HSP20 family protein
MTLIRWSPRTEMESFACDPFLRRFFAGFDTVEGNADRPWYPRLDLVEEKDKLVAQVELPGVDPKDVQIHLQGDVLTVQGERKQERASQDTKLLKREHCYGSFTRTVQLPYRVQADKVTARYKDGVMTIALPKAEEFVGRQIPVEIAS